MTALEMPAAREFGWRLKPTSSTRFGIHERPNGQFCVVLNHSLVRGCTSEMLHWWFLNFPNLEVRLRDIPGYEDTSVAAYLLWHPSDHHSAQLSGELGPGGTSRAGARIHIREAMQYLTYGWRFPVDTEVQIFYCAADGWAMGRTIPLLGKVMSLKIHFRDVVEAGTIVGVHYHYEIVIGVSGENAVARFVNRRIKSHFSTEFFEAWHLHNAIEVGTFENFLPALHAQRDTPGAFEFAREMDGAAALDAPGAAFDPDLFEARMEGFRQADDTHAFQGPEAPSILD